jgi:hypothetical protein
MEGYGLPNALRLTIGSPEANRAVIEGLASFLGAASPGAAIRPAETGGSSDALLAKALAMLDGMMP